ncbi:MAG TPA: DUF4386 domain-containing protein [Thermoanaerobaculia bacterium]|nr:DUF4386 domain-containing protein [Thermoanaerobaculia bacterium]
MTDRIAESSPRLIARICGLLYLVEIAAHGYGLFALSSLMVRDDAAATATRILASERVFRLGFVADVVGIAAYVGVTALLYVLLEPVSRRLSLFAAFFSLAGCAIFAANLVNHLAPLFLLDRAHDLTALGADQLQALALTSLKLYGQGFAISMVFFGFYCLTIGYLISKSTFLPRILGPLLMLAGSSYLINSFAGFLAPTFLTHQLSLVLLAPGIAEVLLCLWLIVVGVDAARWLQQQAAAAVQGR